MTTINTVLGPISADSLGCTLMHEHLIVSAAGVPQDYPELLGPDYKGRFVRGLTRAKKGGIDTIVDATTLDLGRDVNIMADASRATGVNIIAVSGWWMESPFFLGGVSADRLSKLFIREIKKGISGTGIKAGILKAASDKTGVTAWQETVLRAVARAHLSTGAPIMLHSSSPMRVGEKQLAILKEEGVKLNRVKLDHSIDTTDISYLMRLLEQGCYLGIDRFPGKSGASLAERIKTIKTLIDAGFADRLLLSHDFALMDISLDYPPKNRPGSEEALLDTHGFLYIKKVVLPRLKELGVPEKVLTGLCVTGPRNFFSGK